MPHRRFAMCEPVIDALANDLRQIMLHAWRNVFPQNIPAQWKRQPAFRLPPLAEVEQLAKPRTRVGELAFVYDQPNGSAPDFTTSKIWSNGTTRCSNSPRNSWRAR